MNTILIHRFDNKFFRNLSLVRDENINIVSEQINKNIYELYYKYNFKTIIISANSIDNSILQFAIEYGDSVSICVYIADIDTINTTHYEPYKNFITFIYSKGSDKPNIKSIKIPYLINEALYSNKNLEKSKYICCFLDNVKALSSKLIESLYPNNRSLEYGIRMYNNSNIQHHQNLGIIDEVDRSNILKEAEYYLDLDGEYTIEASIVECKILDENTLSLLSEKKIEIPQCQSYKDFLRSLV
jgi:hypothetical protein